MSGLKTSSICDQSIASPSVKKKKRRQFVYQLPNWVVSGQDQNDNVTVYHCEIIHRCILVRNIFLFQSSVLVENSKCVATVKNALRLSIFFNIYFSYYHILLRVRPWLCTPFFLKEVKDHQKYSRSLLKMQWTFAGSDRHLFVLNDYMWLLFYRYRSLKDHFSSRGFCICVWRGIYLILKTVAILGFFFI